MSLSIILLIPNHVISFTLVPISLGTCSSLSNFYWSIVALQCISFSGQQNEPAVHISPLFGLSFHLGHCSTLTRVPCAIQHWSNLYILSLQTPSTPNISSFLCFRLDQIRSVTQWCPTLCDSHNDFFFSTGPPWDTVAYLIFFPVVINKFYWNTTMHVPLDSEWGLCVCVFQWLLFLLFLLWQNIRNIYLTMLTILKCTIQEKAMATHSSTLAWKILWLEEPGRLHAVHGVTKSRTRLNDFTLSFPFMYWRRKWQPTPVFLPGESQGRGSLVGCHPWVTQSQTRLKQFSSSSSKCTIQWH